MGNENCLVTVKLFKKLEEKLPNPQEGTYEYVALGEYDRINFKISSDMEALCKSIDNPTAGMEQSILISAEDGFSGDRFMNSAFGAISFFLVDEKVVEKEGEEPQTFLFDLAEVVQKRMQIKVEGENEACFIDCRAYVTMGSSAIAVVGLCESTTAPVSAYRMYIKKLHELLKDEEVKTVYTYTIVFLRPDAFQANCSEVLDNVLITFSRKTKTGKEVTELLEAIEKKLKTNKGSRFSKGVFPGTNDFYILMSGIKMSELVSLYKANGSKLDDGILASEKPYKQNVNPDQIIWYEDYCDSSFTTLFFEGIL